MPAIRDASFAYEALTTDAGLTIPMCAYAEGDLLFAFCTGDTGAPTWGCSNGVGSWTQLFARNNTCSMVVYWKYAAASGEGDVVITSTVNETYDGAVVAVRDVYQGYSGGSPPLQSNAAQAAAFRFTVPTITTSAADSLCLVVASSSGSAPSLFFTESALQELVKVDGTAEGTAVGWFLQRAAGLTTAFDAGCLVTGAGSKATIEVRAPAGGATVIPTYPVSDASILLTPQPGIAWDGNTAMTILADTNFGTSIGGVTCNDATVVAAVTDIGLDRAAFTSMCGVSNLSTANTMGGANAVVASSRYDIGSRNILAHFRHATPAQNQRLSPVASGRGVWFGLRSGTTNGTNYSIWQVHGGDAPLTPGYVQPIVINPANTDTKATAGTVNTADVRNYGFWTGGIGILINQASFCQIWAMDTTVLAGGVAAEPIDVPGIVAAAALNKNRFSSIQQGANQMLCLQAIQFGNGGTNPTYLKLDSTAIEFPTKRNATTKQVNYNGVDNSVGFTYYPGASDTIIHRSSVISSPSKYHWRIDASASASATYDFSGLSIIGAGDVQLRAVTTFSGMTFTDCPTITQNSAAINDCTFYDSKIISAALGDMDNITNCAFVSSATGHGIEVGGTASTISFVGNTFTGFASSDGSTGNEAIYVNIASGTVTINVSGGSTPSIRTAGATVVVNNNVTITLTGLKNPSEVRVFNAGTQTERSGTGAESVTSGSHAFSIPASTAVDVSVLSLGYQNLRILNYSSASSASIPVSQVLDRQYLNP